jgi:hypothetical protein
MQSAAIIGAAALLAGCATVPPPAQSPPQAANLVRLSAKDAPAENGKALNMEFRELSRTSSNSIVEVALASGGSTSSAMFTLRGMCAVTRARGEKFFSTERIATNPTRYKVSFPKTQPAAPPAPGSPGDANRVVSVAECGMFRF